MSVGPSGKVSHSKKWLWMHGKVQFFYFSPEISFWATLVQKIKIASLHWNLVPWLIWISRIQWWWIPVLTGNTFFWANLVPKFRIVCLKWNLAARLIQIYGIQWFSFSDQKYPRSNLVQENKLSVQAEIWLVPGLIRICRIQWRCSLFPISTGNLDFLGKFGTKNQNCQFKLKLGT